MRLLPCLIALLSAACLAPGDRAASNDDCGFFEDCATICPAGEVCSPATPQGLLFGGSPPSDSFSSAPGIIAVGGTQTISITDAATGAPLARSFSAATSPELAVERTRRSAVVVRAITAGQGRLRILEPDGVRLFDRIVIESSPIANVTLGGGLFEERPATAEGQVILAGVPVSRVVRLTDAQGRRLVDESLVVLEGATAAINAWDWWILSALPAGPHTIRFRAGGVERNLVVDVVASADLVQLTYPENGTLSTQTPYACFRAVAGGRTVVGVTWQFTIDGVAAENDGIFVGCVVIPEGTGIRHIVATGGGATGVFDLPTGTAKHAPAPAPLPADASRGERSLLVSETL